MWWCFALRLRYGDALPSDKADGDAVPLDEADGDAVPLDKAKDYASPLDVADGEACLPTEDMKHFFSPQKSTFSHNRFSTHFFSMKMEKN